MLVHNKKEISSYVLFKIPAKKGKGKASKKLQTMQTPKMHLTVKLSYYLL